MISKKQQQRKQWTPLEPSGMIEVEARWLYDDIIDEYPALLFAPVRWFEDGTCGLVLRYGDEAFFTIHGLSEWNEPSKFRKRLIDMALKYGEEMRQEP